LEDFSLLTYDLTTKETSKLTPPDMWAYKFSWSPGSNYIAFESPDEVHRESKSYKIIRVNVNDRSLLPLTDQINDNDAVELQWSGDGTMLSFGYPLRIVFTNEHRSYEIPEFANHCQPLLHFSTWLHQGSKLSMFCENENNIGQLWILDTKTNSANFISEFSELNLRDGIWSEMSWSADDTKLAFTTGRKNAHCATTWEGMPLCPEDIYTYDIKSDALKRIALKNWLNDIRDIEWVQVSSK
jgi:Tol biopolymer transport system component